ncbi:hypothetical protein ASPZODRAFT_849388 [Penicilliopsis zonata CBS 506.65]|uniref:SWIM-type domain-containing protein n=1 Tax=Penicilliopsis zonata CBS 506.65 TaxID=1073090 RepID=A0A1L9SAG8_9EURO|nr:hypothetical protein ASPZODRAFT_849388 [Penicilliopsis zonata CBS 506.65]OJJ44185.1 hypothetical protein ASPZODRAFT_849388 [Penicilliopsis zonata CBS 506.65]
MEFTQSTQFIDRLITQLSLSHVSPQTNNDTTTTRESDRPSNPLASLPPTHSAHAKSLILTLHCLFPNELLLALDILDRKLVRRYLIRREEANTPDNKVSGETFFVISASSPPGAGVDSSSPAEKEKGYEVRLRAWNCTCPTFALACFQHGPETSEPQPDSDADTDTHSPSLYPFGGSIGPRQSAICKHLLACVLAARCPAVFGVDSDARWEITPAELVGCLA